MKEDTHVRQIPGERKRRWFSSNDFDLIVWIDEGGSFAGFELCYDKLRNEHSLRWNPTTGFIHTAIDSGEHRPGKHKASPLLVANGRFDARRIHAAFTSECGELPIEVAGFVLRALEAHPDYANHDAPANSWSIALQK